MWVFSQAYESINAGSVISPPQKDPYEVGLLCRCSAQHLLCYQGLDIERKESTP